MTEERVATSKDEEKYLPPEWQGVSDTRYEIVWFVNDEEGLLRGELVDTRNSQTAPISVLKLDPDDMDSWFTVCMIDEWLPISTSEG